MFKLGKADNPKVNAILLVNGGPENTHKEHFDDFRQALVDYAIEKNQERERAEMLFNSDLYDFDSKIDGQGFFNQLLERDYAIELLTIVFLYSFFKVLPK